VAQLWELRLARRAVTGFASGMAASRIGWNAASSTVHEQALGSGQRRCTSLLLRFVKPLQSGRLRWLHHDTAVRH
jgi:hypothetical protein